MVKTLKGWNWEASVEFKIVNNDGSYGPGFIAMIIGGGLHMGLTLDGAMYLRDTLNTKIRNAEAAWRRKRDHHLDRLRAKADAGTAWTQRDADTWRRYKLGEIPESVVIKPPGRRAKQKEEDGRADK